jgi:lipoate-protein ligase B
VTTHGFALNVSTDLSAFTRMVPCGFMHEVASLERLGVHADVRDVASRVGAALGERLGRSPEWGTVPGAEGYEIPDDAPVRTAEDLTRAVIAA